MKQVTEKKKDRRIQTLFITMFPVLLIALVSNVTTGLSRVMLQIAIIFFQFVVIKNILDDYYKYLH